jgi:hypothetical protein
MQIMPRTNSLGSFMILQLALGVFFILIGLEVLIYYNSTVGQLVNGFSNMFGGSKQVIESVIAVIEIVAGAILILTLFLPMGRGIFNFIVLLIFVLWVAKIVYSDFFLKQVFQPNWLTWLKELALDIVVAIGIWVTRAKASS